MLKRRLRLNIKLRQYLLELENCKFEGFFVKNPSNSLKTFIFLQQRCKKIRKSFWGFKGIFFQKVPLLCIFVWFYASRRHTLKVGRLKYIIALSDFCKNLKVFSKKKPYYVFWQSFKDVCKRSDAKRIRPRGLIVDICLQKMHFAF